MNRTAIQCRSCGSRIGTREVMRTGLYPRPFGPSVVLVRYRCSRCKRIGEQYVDQAAWEEGILQDASTDATQEEQTQFEKLGPIAMKELAEFHEALENADLAEINAEFRKKNR